MMVPLFLFRTCSGSADIGTNEKLIVLGDYTIIRPDVTSSALLNEIESFKQKVEQYTDGKVSLYSDLVRGDIDENAKEILVGVTNRPQTSQVLAKISGLAFAIEEVGSKIVIVGSTEAKVAEAMDYFVKHYAAKSRGNGTFPIPEGLVYLSVSTPAVDLVSGGVCTYRIIRPKDANATEAALVKKLQNAIAYQTGVEVVIEDDRVGEGERRDGGAREILLLDTDYSETDQAESDWPSGRYGVKIIGNKIVVIGGNDEAKAAAADRFVDLVTRFTVWEAGGGKGIYIPKDTAVLEIQGKYFLDIPEYTDGTIRGTYDCGNDNLAIYIANTTKQAYTAYRRLLESEGYTLYGDNTIGDNAYATYTNRNGSVHVYYLHYLNEVRIITAPLSSALLPPTENAPYQKVTDSKIALMALDVASHDDNGLGIVVTLEDGSYIIVDGGYEQDAAALYQYLVTHNKRTDGRVVVAAWVLTHGHGDHYYCFRRFVSAYGSRITVENVIANDNALVSDFTNTLASASWVFGGSRLVKPHSGQRLSIRNAVVDILYTHEDLYPQKAEVGATFNNSCTVLRMTIAGQTLMIAADAEAAANNVLCNMYKEHLKSDILQVPHHGYPAVTIQFYNYIDPAVVLYAVSESGFNRLKTSESNAHLLNKLNVRQVILADWAHKRTLVLPYVPGSGIKE